MHHEGSEPGATQHGGAGALAWAVLEAAANGDFETVFALFSADYREYSLRRWIIDVKQTESTADGVRRLIDQLTTTALTQAHHRHPLDAELSAAIRSG